MDTKTCRDEKLIGMITVIKMIEMTKWMVKMTTMIKIIKRMIRTI